MQKFCTQRLESLIYKDFLLEVAVKRAAEGAVNVALEPENENKRTSQISLFYYHLHVLQKFL